MPRVIVNSTPLIILSNINHLDLLKKLYSEIYIPEAVFNEVTEKADSACQQIKSNTDWIHVCKITNESQKRIYQAKLHAGEVEVMILGYDIQNGRVSLGLKQTQANPWDSIAELKAKKTGIIKEVTPLMNQLISNGFYITKEIYDLVKSEAGE